MVGDVTLGDLPPFKPRLLDLTATEAQRWRSGLISGLKQMGREAEQENAAEAVKALTEIALETKNQVLAETCRNVIGLILAEYSAAACNEGSGSDGDS